MVPEEYAAQYWADMDKELEDWWFDEDDGGYDPLIDLEDVR